MVRGTEEVGSESGMFSKSATIYSLAALFADESAFF
jgi:hypothetical protein